MKKIIYVSIVFGSFFLSCKRDDGETVAPRKVTMADMYPENGYVSGTIKSKTSGDVSFEKGFNHQLDLETACYSINQEGDYVIHLVKADKFGSVKNQDKKTDIAFILKSDLKRTKLTNLHSSIYADSNATYITKFNIDQDVTTPGSMTVTNVTFDLATGKLKAHYSINVSSAYTSSNEAATIVGEIDTKLINIRYRTGDL